MKTINWQTKALTLFIAAAALWLAPRPANRCRLKGSYHPGLVLMTRP